MKSLGFLLIIAGVLIAYLGFNGKLSDAINAIRTGSIPGDNVQMSGDASNGFSTVV